MEETTTMATPAIRLFQSEKHDKANPSTRISWCISREAAADLRQRGVQKPQLLLMVLSKNPTGGLGEEVMNRSLVTLSDGATYLQFRRSGDYWVVPIIVWDLSDEVRAADLVKTDRFGSYAAGILLSNGGLIDSDSMIKGEALEVIVDESLFAKKPPSWLYNWATEMIKGEPRDQCALRARYLFAFTIQPIIYLVLMVVVIIFVACCLIAASFAAIGLGFGRNVDFSAAFKAEEPSDIFYAVDSWEDSFYISGPAFLVPLMPLVGIVATLVALMITLDLGTSLLLGAAFMLTSSLLTLALTLRKKRMKSKKAEASAAKSPPEPALLPQLEPILCANREKNSRPIRRPIHLAFADIKAKVCKPFED